MKQSKVYQIRLTETLLDKAHKAAEKKNTKLSIAVKEFINQFVKEDSKELLTRELLIRGGADEFMQFDIAGFGIFNYDISEKSFMIGGDDACTFGHCIEIKCEYLHEWKNLHLALTGVELEVKEDSK